MEHNCLCNLHLTEFLRFRTDLGRILFGKKGMGFPTLGFFFPAHELWISFHGVRDSIERVKLLAMVPHPLGYDEPERSWSDEISPYPAGELWTKPELGRINSDPEIAQQATELNQDLSLNNTLYFHGLTMEEVML